MKYLITIFLIGVGYFLFACGDKAQKDNREQENLAKVIERYEEAIRINPNNNLGYVYYQQGKLDEAIVEFKTALSLNPNLTKAHSNLGTVYSEQGNNEQAITHYKEFIRLARTNPTLRSNIPEIENRIQIIQIIEFTSKLNGTEISK